jgi:hypothetical protein
MTLCMYCLRVSRRIGVWACFEGASTKPPLDTIGHPAGTAGSRGWHGAPMALAALAALCAQGCVTLLPSMARFEEMCSGGGAARAAKQS